MARMKVCVTRIEVTDDGSKRYVRRRVLRNIQPKRGEHRRSRAAMEMAVKSDEFGRWADLSKDLIHRIMGMLCLGDKICSSVVCKDWHSAITRMPRPMPLSICRPWRFNYVWEKSDGNPRLNLRTELNDADSGRRYCIETPLWNSRKSMGFGAAPCALKDGWFLFAKKYKYKTHFFLYNPFSKRYIWLPTLAYYFSAATFSKSPLFPHIVVFAAYRSGYDSYVATCRVGDKSWNTMAVDAYFMSRVTSVVYCEEKNEFYCVSPRLNLACFGVQDRSWNLLTIQALQGLGAQEQRDPHLLQYEGQLLLVFTNPYERFFVYRFDWTTMEWEMLGNIDHLIGLSRQDFVGLFTKNLGSGAFLFVNEHYIPQNPKEYWIDSPRISN